MRKHKTLWLPRQSAVLLPRRESSDHFTPVATQSYSFGLQSFKNVKEYHYLTINCIFQNNFISICLLKDSVSEMLDCIKEQTSLILNMLITTNCTKSCISTQLPGVLSCLFCFKGFDSNERKSKAFEESSWNETLT